MYFNCYVIKLYHLGWVFFRGDSVINIWVGREPQNTESQLYYSVNVVSETISLFPINFLFAFFTSLMPSLHPMLSHRIMKYCTSNKYLNMHLQYVTKCLLVLKIYTLQARLHPILIQMQHFCILVCRLGVSFLRGVNLLYQKPIFITSHPVICCHTNYDALLTTSV